MSSCAVHIDNLEREYSLGRGRTITALRGISFDIEKGELFGLLGPNGAGKTTTIKILATLLTPTRGTAMVLNMDVSREASKIRSRINYAFGGDRGLYWRLTGRENLHYFSSLYRVPTSVQARRIPELLDLVGLTERADSKVETYSRGMKQRLHIARSLVNSPELILMDEPTIGLDPSAAHDLRALAGRLTNEGVTVLLTTHHMGEAESMCDRIAIINHGQLVAIGTANELKRLAVGYHVLELEASAFPPGSDRTILDLEGVLAAQVMERGDRQVMIVHVDTGEEIGRVTAALSGVHLLRMSERDPLLEDAYLQIVKGSQD